MPGLTSASTLLLLAFDSTSACANPAVARIRPHLVQGYSNPAVMSIGGRCRAAALTTALSALSASSAASAAAPRSTPWSYSTFLEAVETSRVEKVSFSADGKQVLSIDKDGNRHESLILPEDSANLVKTLTARKIVFAVQAPAQESAAGALGGG